jgi:glycosyltransferase involved in cell wall biosynthesis
MSLGIPALVSDIPALREITMDRACYLPDPKDAAAMADRIMSINEQGAAAKPSAETVALMRHSFAPTTIAKKYLKVLLGS